VIMHGKRARSQAQSKAKGYYERGYDVRFDSAAKSRMRLRKPLKACAHVVDALGASHAEHPPPSRSAVGTVGKISVVEDLTAEDVWWGALGQQR
jgi:hypothetical protein